MKHILTLSIALAVLLATPTLFAAFAEDTTLSGEPVDIACYLGGRHGEAHASCAASCAERGQPIGLRVDEDGESVLYLVLGANGKPAKDYMADHMGKQVQATGTVAESGGMKVITVSAVSE